MSETIQQQIINLKREILELKTIQKVTPNVQGYWYDFIPVPPGRYKIIYDDGDEPVLTNYVTDSTCVLSTVVDNVQYLWSYAQYPATLYLFTNRPIKSATYDPE